MAQLTNLEQKFIQFHNQNPQVYSWFKKFAFEAFSRGKKKISSKLIFERMRWEAVMSTTSTDEFELNNDYTAYYARMFVEDHPGYRDFFEFRKTRGEKLFKSPVSFTT